MDGPLSEQPGLPPPSGETSNFHVHNPQNDALLATVALCIVLTTLLMAARLIVRFRFDKKMKLEDYTSTACWVRLDGTWTTSTLQALIGEQVGFVTYCGIAIAIGDAGAGRHQWNVSVASIIRIGLLGNVIEIVYGPTIWLAKLSVLLQYKHIFTPTKKPGIVYWSIHALIWGNLLFYSADTLVVIFQCRPRAKIWNFLLPGTCLNGTTNFIVTGAWNVLSDSLILALPLYAIWQLKMPLRRKVSVGAVFATGLFLAELATVVLCGSVIFLPKFFQLFRGHKNTSSNQQPSSSKERSRQNGSRSRIPNDAAPWTEIDHPTWKTGARYIPLQEVSIKHDSAPKANTRDYESVAGSIRKTIDIETHQC